MRITHTILAIACVVFVGHFGSVGAASSADLKGSIAENVRVSPELLSMARDMWSLIPAICRENRMGLFVECAHEDEPFLASRKLFVRTSTFGAVAQYLNENGLVCSLRGSSMVIRSKHLDGSGRNPLEIPFPPDAFAGTARQLESRIVEFCAREGIIVPTGGIKGRIEDDTVFSFPKGECKTLRDVFLGIARRGGKVVTVLSPRKSDTVPAVLYVSVD